MDFKHIRNTHNPHNYQPSLHMMVSSEKFVFENFFLKIFLGLYTVVKTYMFSFSGLCYMVCVDNSIVVILIYNNVYVSISCLVEKCKIETLPLLLRVGHFGNCVQAKN